MRRDPLVSRFTDLRSGDDGGLGLLFLHEFSSPDDSRATAARRELAADHPGPSRPARGRA